MKHLLSIDDLTQLEIRALIDRAIHHPPVDSSKNKKPVALVFMEPSTRTRVSFLRAAEVLGRSSVYLGAADSSLTKSETLRDSLLNLEALGYGSFVVRVPDSESLEELRDFSGGPIVNGGNGSTEHPTQALLDLATMLESVAGGDWDKLSELNIVISGDLKHSRVVGSWAKLAQKLKLNIVWCSPEAWRNSDAESKVGRWEKNRDQALKVADVWMALRVQKERFGESESSGLDDYIRDFQVNSDKLGGDEMKGIAGGSKSLFLMHPGPVNWGIELSDELKNYSKSLILDQVKMGVAVRSVILDFLS